MVAPYVRSRLDSLAEAVMLVVLVGLVAVGVGLLVGCSATPERIVVREPIEVQVPVPILAQPPEELLEPVVGSSLPDFVAPSDPSASSALTPEGERRLKHLLLELQTRIRQWQVWAAGSEQER